MIVEYTRNKDGFNQRGGYNQRDGLYFKQDIFTMASNREWLQLERWLNLERIRYLPICHVNINKTENVQSKVREELFCFHKDV